MHISRFSLLAMLLMVGCSENDTPAPVVKEAYTKANDILWASPKGFDLTMDIYTPTSGKASYPVIVMYHGGGWLINTKNIMNDAAVYLAAKSEYVVCNVNYRLLGDLNNTVKMNEIVEDAFGAVLWVKDNIAKYKGDAAKICVTGDSAGGHLAAVVATQGQNLESDGFSGATLGFKPTYLPAGKTAEHVALTNGASVQAAMLSYGVFDLYASALGGLEKESNYFWTLGKANARGVFGDGTNVNDNPALYKQVSPVFNIPQATERKLPPLFFSVGSQDNLVTPLSVESYISKLKGAGQFNVEYWIHEGRGHAFLDSGTNFQKDAPLALDKMIAFLNKIFY